MKNPCGALSVGTEISAHLTRAAFSMNYAPMP
jgi:hypothetical protein